MLVIWYKLAYYSIYFYENPSAGIGRQGELKIRWRIVVNVQVVFRINNNKACIIFSYVSSIYESYITDV